MPNYSQMWVDIRHWYGVHQPTIHRRIKYALCTAALVGACFYIDHYFHERNVDRIADQVNLLEQMVDSKDTDGARPLAQSLYQELRDENDPRLKALYDSIVFPCYKTLKGR